MKERKIRTKEPIREPLKRAIVVFTYLGWKQVKNRIP